MLLYCGIFFGKRCNDCNYTTFLVMSNMEIVKPVEAVEAAKTDEALNDEMTI